jgi:probable F420-dependent oxidoreductase
MEGPVNDLANFSVLLSNEPDVDELLALAALVESSGYERVWLAETGGLEVAGLGAVIARTTRLEVGTAIVPVYSRTPALLAMMASTWARLGGGERPVHLGIGAGGQVIVEQWHGVDYGKPLQTTRETIAVLRQALAGERTSVAGASRRSEGFRLQTGPAPSVKVYVGGMGPAMVSLAAERADGLIVTWLSPRVLQGFRTSFRDAATAHGRKEGEVKLVARVYAAVTSTPDLAREEVRKELVEYVVSPPYQRYFRSVGFDEEADAVVAAFNARDREAAVRAVSDRLLDEVLVVGTSAEEIRDRLMEYVSAGADDIMVQPVPTARGGDPRLTIEAVAKAARG